MVGDERGEVGGGSGCGGGERGAGGEGENLSRSPEFLSVSIVWTP